MYYYLIDNAEIVTVSTERDICVDNQQERGGGVIVEHINLYNMADHIYSNGSFSERTRSTEEVKEDRRVERGVKFGETLDIMNGVWYDTLSTQQKTELRIWRQAWLDYPETGIKPEDLDIFPDQTAEKAVIGFKRPDPDGGDILI